jgi:hypothetical protein
MDSFLKFLLEADGDTDTQDPKASDKDDSNKDITADKTDTSSDNSGSDDDSGTSDDDSSTDDSQYDVNYPDENEGSENTDDAVAADDDSSQEFDPDTDTPSPETPEDEETQKKRVLLYDLFTQLQISYRNLLGIYTRLTDLDLPASNLYTIKLIKDKVQFNITSLDSLLIDVDFFTTKKYADLLAIYNTYMSDLRGINQNLQLFVKANNINADSKKKSK